MPDVVVLQNVARNRSQLLLSCHTLLAAWMLTCGHAAAQQETEHERPPIPEPLLNETMTDIDGSEPGELELSANGSRRQALKGSSYVLQTSLEAEWLATRRLGIYLEPAFVNQDPPPSHTASKNAIGVAGGLSWKLLQDFENDFHLQAEVGGRYPLEPSTETEPGDPALPFALDLRAALRIGGWTLRGSAGGTAGGRAAHLPLRSSLCAFKALGAHSFIGIEADGDGARQHPFLLAADAVLSLAATGLPLKIGVSVPWALGLPSRQPSLGVFVRLFLESAREAGISALR
jgi:hypothetical protein